MFFAFLFLIGDADDDVECFLFFSKEIFEGSILEALYFSSLLFLGLSSSFFCLGLNSSFVAFGLSSSFFCLGLTSSLYFSPISINSSLCFKSWIWGSDYFPRVSFL